MELLLRLAYLPKVNSNGALKLLKAHIHEVLDGVWAVEPQRVRLRLVLLSLQQVALQLRREVGRESSFARVLFCTDKHTCAF